MKVEYKEKQFYNVPGVKVIICCENGKINCKESEFFYKGYFAPAYSVLDSLLPEFYESDHAIFSEWINYNTETVQQTILECNTNFDDQPINF